MPVPGWTLPSVMTAGAGQILLKASGLVPERCVLAGSGPLLYLLAVQMARAGKPPLALIETQGAGDILRAVPHLARGARGWRSLVKGVGLLAELRRFGVRRITGARDLRITGTERAEAIEYTAKGRSQRIACNTVLLHQGVVPNTQISQALRLAHVWLEGQQAFAPRCDRWGETSAAGIFVAGDGAGIAGGIAAASAGQVAALQVAYQLGRMDSVHHLLCLRQNAPCVRFWSAPIRHPIRFWPPPMPRSSAAARRSPPDRSAIGRGWVAPDRTRPKPLDGWGWGLVRGAIAG